MNLKRTKSNIRLKACFASILADLLTWTNAVIRQTRHLVRVRSKVQFSPAAPVDSAIRFTNFEIPIPRMILVSGWRRDQNFPGKYPSGNCEPLGCFGVDIPTHPPRSRPKQFPRLWQADLATPIPQFTKPQLQQTVFPSGGKVQRGNLAATLSRALSTSSLQLRDGPDFERNPRVDIRRIRPYPPRIEMLLSMAGSTRSACEQTEAPCRGVPDLWPVDRS